MTSSERERVQSSRFSKRPFKFEEKTIFLVNHPSLVFTSALYRSNHNNIAYRINNSFARVSQWPFVICIIKYGTSRVDEDTDLLVFKRAGRLLAAMVSWHSLFPIDDAVGYTWNAAGFTVGYECCAHTFPALSFSFFPFFFFFSLNKKRFYVCVMEIEMETG